MFGRNVLADWFLIFLTNAPGLKRELMMKRHLLVALCVMPLASTALATPQAPLSATGVLALIEEGQRDLVGTTKGFVWSPTDGFTQTQVPENEEGGRIVVGATSSNLPGGGFRWYPQLGLIPADATDADGVIPTLWNESGDSAQVVYWSPEDIEALGQLLGLPEGVSILSVSDVSEGDQVLGRAINEEDGSEFYFTASSNGPFTAFETPPGVELDTLTEVSDSGHVIGTARVDDGAPQAVVIDPSGTITVLQSPSSGPARAFGVNAQGWVVGASADDPSQAMMWAADGTPLPLQDALSSPLPAGLSLTAATGVNANGQVIAFAESPSGALEVALLSPSPNGAGFQPVVIGEVFSGDNKPQSIPQLYLTNSGSIIGECGAGSRDCPVSNQIDLSQVDSDITNLFDPFGGDSPFGAFQPFIPRTDTGLGGPIAGDTGPTSPNGANRNTALSNTGGSGFSALSFPNTSGTAELSAASTTAAAVPLPGAAWLLALSMGLFLGGARVASRRRSDA